MSRGRVLSIFHHRQLYKARVIARVVNALRGFVEIPRLGPENIGHETFADCGRRAETSSTESAPSSDGPAERRDSPWAERSGRAAVGRRQSAWRFQALAIAAAKNVGRDHQLIAAHGAAAPPLRRDKRRSAFTTQSESVPLVEAIRLATGCPLIFIGAVNTSESNARTSGRPEASRWSSTSHCDHVIAGAVAHGWMGRARNGTGLAGSETYSSNAAPAAGLAPKAQLQSGMQIQRRRLRIVQPLAHPAGQAGKRRHSFVPVSNAVTGATSGLRRIIFQDIDPETAAEFARGNKVRYRC